MKVGDMIHTPRFLKVRIAAVYEGKNAEQDARRDGYTEPTHYKGDYQILGKVTEPNHMVFAAVKE
ncbi:MAG: hypothetical protein GXY05_13780 [Clostridiales bacterium]|mgnify:CR=1 FL=1|nr:hypothetical protein [Clostridiales bacterium]